MEGGDRFLVNSGYFSKSEIEGGDSPPSISLTTRSVTYCNRALCGVLYFLGEPAVVESTAGI